MWLNDIEKAIEKKNLHIVNDSKTPSGKVHVGSLRGVLIHDAVSRHLNSKGVASKFTYGIDDYDPMDGLPHDAPKTLEQYMGQPLCNIPAPSNSRANDFADHYISEFTGIFKELDVDAEIYRMRDVYRKGLFNDAITTILEHADVVREIYKTVSGSERPGNWHPFQVICEQCGKIGTTEVFGYSGGLVSYRCKPDLVSWASGCGYEGQASPLNGNGKLPWKLEWAAKWRSFGITIEGAGKDHCTKGGSRDIARAVLRRVFKKNPPLNIPYEFFLVKGAKMSSSKGVGVSAREMADFLPAEVLRYLMIKTVPKRSVNFSTELNPMLKVFNEYDTLVSREYSGDLNGEAKDLYNAVRVDTDPKVATPISFQLLISMLQLPHINSREVLEKRLQRQLTPPEVAHLQQRLKSAGFWLEHYAGDDEKYTLQDTLPDVWLALTYSKKLFLIEFEKCLASVDWCEEAIQQAIFDTARIVPLPPKDAFSALYCVFLNKASGPKAGALLSFLDKSFVIERLKSIFINDWYACIDDVGVEMDAFIEACDSLLPDSDNIALSASIYYHTKSEKALEDGNSVKFGMGAIFVTFENKARLFRRMIKRKFEGYGALSEFNKSMIGAMEILGRNIQEKVNAEIKINEDIATHIIVSE